MITYYFDFGETDYDYVTIQLGNSDIYLDKEVLNRTDKRVKFMARSNSFEASRGTGQIFCYKDDQVVKEIPIRTWVGSPLRLTPYSRGDKWGPVPKSNLMDSTSDLDSDGDGILDHKEITLGTDPDDADTDDDGLSDGDEFYTRGKVLAASEYFGIQIKLDPRNPDTDFDGIPDGTEVGNTEPVLGIDGVKDVSIYEDGTFVGEGQQRLTFEYEDLETTNDLFDPNEMFLMRKANETSTRFRYLADMDPKTITNPVSNDTNGDDEFDGVQDSNGNGRLDDGESDPLIGLYVNDRWAPNKESRSILYVARLDDDLEMMANHPGGWGNELEYFFDFGGMDLDYVDLVLPEDFVTLDKTRLFRPRDETLSRTSFRITSKSSVETNFPGEILCYKDDLLVRRLTITVVIGPPKPPAFGYE